MKTSKEVVNLIIKFEVNRLLTKKSRKVLTDPIEIITHDFLYNICNKESKIIVKESINEVAKDLIIENRIKKVI